MSDITVVPDSGPVQEPKKRKRVAMWSLIIWTVLMAASVFIGAGNANCEAQTGDSFISAQDAQDACAAGAGIGISLLIVVWVIGLVAIACITVIVRLGRR